MKNKNIFKIIKNILYYTVVGILLMIISISFLIPGGIIEVFGVGWYRVVSSSMEPIIRIDDYIVVKKIDNTDNLEDGDIIVFETFFYNNGKYQKAIVTHHYYQTDELGHIITYPHSQFNLSEEERRYDSWRKSSSEEYFVTSNDLVGLKTKTLKTKELINFFSFLFQTPLGITLIIINVSIITGAVILIKKAYKKTDINEDKEDDSNELEWYFKRRI